MWFNGLIALFNLGLAIRGVWIGSDLWLIVLPFLSAVLSAGGCLHSYRHPMPPQPHV